jgi:hypothetical protein
MSAKGLAAQQMGPSAQGNPGQQPQACTVGISDVGRAELDKYANPEVKSRVLDVVARKRGDGSSWQ